MGSLANSSRVLVTLLLAVLVGQVRGAPPSNLPRTVETSGVEFITPRTEAAVQRGLEYLAKAQRADGSYGGAGLYDSHVAVSSLAGLAFLASGSTPGRGPYGEHIERSVRYVLDKTDSSGLISHPEHRQQNPMYGHGFSTLFLAEVYGMTFDARIRDKLKLAVRLIINSQNREGGWRYFPKKSEADVSATVCQMMALRAARNAGIAVPKATVDDCIAYIRKCQNPDGGFSYMLSGMGGMGSQSLLPRSAAGLVALYSAGVYEDKQIERGLRYLLEASQRPEQFRQEGFYYYGQYYAAQAMWYAGGDYWRRWYPRIRDELLGRQTGNGSWVDVTVCPEYGTAMACIVLQLPNNCLPIFQR